MKKIKNHLHALSFYEEISIKHFLALWISLLYAKVFSCTSVTVHLPLELQHPNKFKKLGEANNFIKFGEFWKKKFNKKLYWENSPLLIYGKWNLKYGQSSWELIPNNIELCLDTGHLMLGSRNINIARKRIYKAIKDRNTQIKHLHIHENDLVHDLHKKPSKVLNKKIINFLKKGRTFIYEP